MWNCVDQYIPSLPVQTGQPGKLQDHSEVPLGASWGQPVGLSVSIQGEQTRGNTRLEGFLLLSTPDLKVTQLKSTPYLNVLYYSQHRTSRFSTIIITMLKDD